MGDTGAADRGEERLDMRGVGRARIEDGERVFADQEGVGAAEREGPGVPGGDALAGRNRS